MRLVGAVGEMLCFKADGTVFGISHAVMASQTSIQKVGCVDLYARLAAKHLYPPATLGVVQNSCRKRLPVSVFFKYKTMIQLLHYRHSLVGKFAVLAEIHGSILARDEFSGRDLMFIDLKIVRGM